MSVIRSSSDRKYSVGPSMYVYPTGDRIDWACADPGDAEDFIEVMFRVLEQSGVDVDEEMVNQVRVNRFQLPTLAQMESTADLNAASHDTGEGDTDN